MNPLVLQIEEGDIYASISQKDGMVLFHDNPDKYDSTCTVERLQKEVTALFTDASRAHH